MKRAFLRLGLACPLHGRGRVLLGAAILTLGFMGTARAQLVVYSNNDRSVIVDLSVLDPSPVAPTAPILPRSAPPVRHQGSSPAPDGKTAPLSEFATPGGGQSLASPIAPVSDPPGEPARIETTDRGARPPEHQGQDRERQVLSVPFPFYNDAFGAAVGWVHGAIGYPQPQATVLGTAMAGSQGTAMMFVVGQDLRFDGSERLFIDPVAQIGYFDEIDSYIDGDPGFPNERAGSNGSDENNFVTGKGWDNFFRVKFKYLLPIGNGRDQIVTNYEIERGLLVDGASGGSSLNPLESGRTFLQTRPFYRSQEIDGDDVDEDFKTNGLDFDVFWDNRDFQQNPSRGQGVLLKASRDFGWFDSTDSWTNLEAEYDQYFSLGATDTFRQRVLAFDVWTAYSPTWNDEGNGKISNRPPAYTGATLGGLFRMRAFPSQRFNDRAAIYYAAELRLTPEWNPFEYWPAIQRYVGIDWLQFVPFVEVGRVAENWDVKELHSSMKWNLGFGIRARAKGFVVRVDSAWSTESAGVQMMISQPFQF